MEPDPRSSLAVDGHPSNAQEETMRNRVVVSLIAATLLSSGAAFAQSTTVEGAANGARAGGDVGGAIGAMVGGTVGAAVAAAVGAGMKIQTAVITSIEGERAPSVVVRERVVVGEPLPPEVELR